MSTASQIPASLPGTIPLREQADVSVLLCAADEFEARAIAAEAQGLPGTAGARRGLALILRQHAGGAA